jgi:outer membrane protein OmpA-like peptidoglycan-associated protein
VKYTYTVKAPGYDSLADVFTINKKTDLYQYYSKDYTLKLIPKPEPVVAKVEEVVTTTPTVAATEVKKVEEVKAAPVEEKKVVEAKKELVAKAETEKKEVKKSVEKFLPETVYFDYNSSAIAEGEKAKLDKLVLYLKSVSAISVTVKGYTDNVGGDSFNKNLSLNRAKSAADYLKQQGISEGQISVKSYGLNKPVDSNKTDEGRSHNRRVEIELGTK